MTAKLEKEADFTKCKKLQKSAYNRAGQKRGIDTDLRKKGLEIPNTNRILPKFGKHISNVSPL